MTGLWSLPPWAPAAPEPSLESFHSTRVYTSPLMSGHRATWCACRDDRGVSCGHPCGGSTRENYQVSCRGCPGVCTGLEALIWPRCDWSGWDASLAKLEQGLGRAGPTRSPRKWEKPALAMPVRRRMKETRVPPSRGRDGANTAVQLPLNSLCLCRGVLRAGQIFRSFVSRFLCGL